MQFGKIIRIDKRMEYDKTIQPWKVRPIYKVFFNREGETVFGYLGKNKPYTHYKIVYGTQMLKDFLLSNFYSLKILKEFSIRY